MPGRLFIVGNACRDVSYRMARLPRPGETLIAGKVTRDLGGKGLNQAIAAARTGADVRVIAALGTDDTADEIVAYLVAEGISPAGLVRRNGTTDSSIILVDDEGENTIVSDTALARSLDPVTLARLLDVTFGDSVLLQGNLAIDTTEAAMLAARSCGAAVILNAAPMQDWLVPLGKYCDVVIFNRSEAAQWTAVAAAFPAGSSDTIAAAATVVTLGGEGCIVQFTDGTCTSLHAPAVPVIDTTGAGDAFAGTFAAQWHTGRDSGLAARLAVLVAADKVQRRGTVSALPSRATIEHMKVRAALENFGGIR
jgi:ribokinase